PSTIWQATLSAFTLPLPGGTTTDKTKLTLFPKGSKFAAVTYNLGGFYISANAANPDACYRFISKAALTPALFSAMPARKSLLNDPTLSATQSTDAVALYKQIATLLDDPNTLTFAGFSLGSSGLQSAPLIPELELFEALDNVIVKNADLQASLKSAETSAKAFQECAAQLPPLDASSVTQQQLYFNAFKDCATRADPVLAPFFAGVKAS
ncbi:MAG TPA: hypothetical protein VKQ72_19890, partial [Aggregatilineales bacterium]|nr:hypothetical protein [Aggregatilineales bacterium]